MNITGFSTGMTVQGGQSFGTLNTDSEAQAAAKAAGDNVEISDEAKQLYAQMQQSGKKPEDMSPEEMKAFLEEHPEAAAMQAEQGKEAQAAPPEGQKPSSGKGGGGGKGGGESASASSSTDSTTTETSLEAEILALELQIEQAEKSGNSAQVEALEAELTALEDELDELTEA